MAKLSRLKQLMIPAPAHTAEPDRAMCVLELALRNLQAIREWYRAQPERNAPGHTATQEISINNIEIALRLALENKTWQPPNA